MNEPLIVKGSDRRQGIALIVVLGLLSMLVILAVAFARLMRVDRLAASNFSDLVAARNIAHTGLARARDDLDGWVNTNVYPLAGIQPSTLGGTDPNRDFLRAGAYELERSVPYAQYLQLMNLVSAGDVKWETILDPASSKPIGRISYAIVDCSGLLDPHYIGQSPGGRRYGVETYEIPLENTQILRNVVEPDALPAQLQAFYQYETLPELLNLGRKLLPTSRPLFSNTPLNDFFITSYYPMGWNDGGAIVAPVYVGGDDADLGANSGLITDEFSAMGISNPANLLRNLQDYVDPDNVPADTSGLYTEAVPMLNEVQVHQRLFAAKTSPTDVTYRNGYEITLECWFPFPGVTNATNYEVAMVFLALGGEPQLGRTDKTPMVLPLPGLWRNAPFLETVKFAITDIPTYDAPEAQDPPEPPTTYVVSFQIREAGSGTVVDQVEPVPLAGAFDDEDLLGKDDWSVGEPVDAYWGAAVDDPRLNWELTNPAQWTEYDSDVNGTMGALNTKNWTLGVGTADDQWAMHVANSNLLVVGEMGHLLYDETEPWHTIDLLDPVQAEILHRFTTYTNTVRRGLVNVNTTNQNVLASALVDAPVERFPGDPGGYTLKPAEALGLAGQIIANGPYENLGDIGRMTLAQFKNGVPALTTKTEAEAILRNSSGLLGVRQNYFTIIVEAQSGEDVDNDGFDDKDVRATQKLLAVVWRDPYGEIPSHVRLFKWVTD